MKVAYWPGCVSRGFTPELHGSMAQVAPLLDIELVPLDRAACCGAGVLAEHNQELADTLNARTFALAALAATFGVTGVVWGGPTAGALGALGAALSIAWLLPFEVRPGFAVAGWSALAASGFGLVYRLPATRVLIGASSIALLAFGALVAIVVVAPPSRLVVDASTVVTGPPVLTDAPGADLRPARAACGRELQGGRRFQPHVRRRRRASEPARSAA